MFIKNTHKGFTLSEVLITLAIIGIVAALTIPSLVMNATKRGIVERLKKNYATLGQAYKQFDIDDTDKIALWETSNNYTRDQFCTKLNCIKTGVGTWPNVMYKHLDGSDYGNNGLLQPTAMLTDGTLLIFNSFNSACTSGGTNLWCGAIILDVNGSKEPNTIGRDTFYIVFSKTSTQPFYFPATDCATGTNLGISCSGKVLSENAINY